MSARLATSAVAVALALAAWTQAIDRAHVAADGLATTIDRALSGDTGAADAPQG